MAISDFIFYGMNSVATCTDGTWDDWKTPIEEGAPFHFAAGTASITGGEAKNYEDNFLVLPQTFGADVVYAKFTVKATGTGIEGEIVKNITAKIPADTWEKGYRYNYEATIDGQTMDVISFDAPTITEWKDETFNMVNDSQNSGQLVEEVTEP